MSSYEHGPASAERLPPWLRRPIVAPGRNARVRGVLEELSLNTVCRSAKCPNQGECFASGTATFLVLGETCTRDCRFCAVERKPLLGPPDDGEPERVAEAAERMGLRHVVVTMVTRDDLADGGAGHVARTVGAVRARLPEATIEVLTSDFGGDEAALDVVLDAAPDVFNHNVETVPRLYQRVRPQADYGLSLRVLRHAGERSDGIPTKSGLMLGLGETSQEVHDVMRDLRKAGVSMLTLGQYLRPGREHLPVARFVEPEEFGRLERVAEEKGFTSVASAPYVRSSYRAGKARGG